MTIKPSIWLRTLDRPQGSNQCFASRMRNFGSGIGKASASASGAVKVPGGRAQRVTASPLSWAEATASHPPGQAKPAVSVVMFSPVKSGYVADTFCSVPTRHSVGGC